jgi:3-methyl-2-oxobutanoate hydroxymethyltransferase
MDIMVHHIKAVRRGCRQPCVIGDMPFMSYNVSPPQAIINAGRLVKEGGCDAVKLEGGIDFASTIAAIVKAGIPVQGHIGLTPQTASALGGFKIQGKNAAAAKQILEDALALEAAGVFSIVLEAVPAPLAGLIAKQVKVPVIGIGAGPDVDGQVLVIHDLIGLFDRFVPKFVKQYINVRVDILDALKQYRLEVQKQTFPEPAHSFSMPEDAFNQLKKMMTD